MNEEQSRQPLDMAQEAEGSLGGADDAMANSNGTLGEPGASGIVAGMGDELGEATATGEIDATGGMATAGYTQAGSISASGEADTEALETGSAPVTVEAELYTRPTGEEASEMDRNAPVPTDTQSYSQPQSEEAAPAEESGDAGNSSDNGQAQPPMMDAAAATDAPAEDVPASNDMPVASTRPGGQATEGESDDEAEQAPIRTARDPRLEDVAANASMEDLLRASEQQYRTLKHGDVVEGRVMKVSREEILVDIGAKTEGLVPNHELQSLSEEERDALQIGDPLLVSVVQPENSDGHAVLSLDRARQEKSWRDLQKQFEASEVIQAKVSGHNKGGLLVNLEGVRGFVPSSQISSMPAGEANKQTELARLQGQPLSLKIIEINRGRNRLILSERQAMQEQRETMRSLLLKELEPGQVRPGTVTSICDFGAFVDIGGADGLIHLSELSWRRVAHPSEVLKVGERIDVYVLSVDPNERKIALSLKRTQPEPWSTITDNYTLGQVVRGTITQLTSFGAFARLEDGIEGLIHVSELAEGRVAHPRNVVNEGDQMELKVIRIDPVKRRIGLSLKRMTEGAEGTDGDQGLEGEQQGEGGGYRDRDESSQSASQRGGEDQQQPQLDAGDQQPQQQEARPQTERPQSQRQFDRPQTRPQQPRRQEPRPERQPPPPMSYGANDEPMGALAAALAGLNFREATDTQDDQANQMPEPGMDAEGVSAYATDVTTDSGEMAGTEGEAAPEDLSPEGGVAVEGALDTNQTGSTPDVEADTDAPSLGDDADMPVEEPVEDARSTIDFTDMSAPEMTGEIREADGEEQSTDASTPPATDITSMMADDTGDDASTPEAPEASTDSATDEDTEKATESEAVSGAEGLPSVADSSTDDAPSAEDNTQGLNVASNGEDAEQDSSATRLEGSREEATEGPSASEAEKGQTQIEEDPLGQ